MKASGDLVEALGEKQAVIAGHDWGAPVVWHAALMRPDCFRAAIGLSVPFRPRSAARPSTVMPQTEDRWFYQLYDLLFAAVRDMLVYRRCGRHGTRSSYPQL